MFVFGIAFIITNVGVIDQFQERAAAFATKVNSVLEGETSVPFGDAVGQRASRISHLRLQLELVLRKKKSELINPSSKCPGFLIKQQLLEFKLNRIGWGSHSELHPITNYYLPITALDMGGRVGRRRLSRCLR